MLKIEKIDFSAGDWSSRFLERVVKGIPFVSWGIDNMEVERWLDYVDFSPIHKACISTKIDNLAGKGFTNDYKINSKQSLNDVVKQLFWEYMVTGNLFLEVVWRKDRQGISGFHIIPAKNVRAARPEDAEYISDKWYYCHDWANWKKAGIIEFHNFNPDDYTSRQLVHIRQYQPGYIFYGVPQYLSALLDVRLSHAISEYNLASIMNSGSPSLWVHLPQNVDSQNEQEDILRRLEERYRGPQGAGRIVLSMGDPDEKPEITQIQSNLQQGMFGEIFALVRENILSGHQIPDPSLIGLPTASGFSSQAEQLKTAHQLFMNTTIKPMQEFVIRELKPVLQLLYPGEDIVLEIQQNQILD